MQFHIINLMSKKKNNSSKISVDVTPGRAIGGLVLLVFLCGGGFLAVQAVQNAQKPVPVVNTSTQPLATLPPINQGAAGQPTQAQQPAAKAQSGSAETFDNLNNWQFKVSSGPNYKFSLVNGELVEEVTGTALHNYFTGGEYGAATIEVDARWVSGNEDKNARFGVALRRTEKSAYYFEYFPFQEGQWMFQIGQNDKFDVLGKGNVPKSAARAVNAANHFKIEMTDKRAKLYINDALLAEVDVSVIPQGSIGLMTTADAGKKSVAGFDNFVVKK